MYKVVILDDEIELLEVLTIVLELRNFKVFAISNWKEITKSLKKFKPDLLLMDVNLGGADGRTLCKTLQKDRETKELPVLLMSASHNVQNNMQGCKPAGFISKPFNINDLAAKIKEILKGLGL